MAKGKPGYMAGNDAAYIEPKFVPNYQLLARDDSGGPDWDPYSATFGDGQEKRGDKAHLSANANDPDDKMGPDGERDQSNRVKGYRKIAGSDQASDMANAKAKSAQME